MEGWITAPRRGFFNGILQVLRGIFALGLAVVGHSCGRLATRSRVARILKYVILTGLSLVLPFILFESVE